MLPLFLELTGFKGVRSAFGVDKKAWDFSDIPDGRIAISGPNGSAKSTLLQNLHPYLIMPDKVKTYSPKSFSFYNETYGVARKDLHWLHYDGRIFRSLVDIDADKRKTKAYLYIKNDNGNWDVFNGTEDGNTENYNNAIESLLGSPRMFFTYVFRSQKARRLSTYTKGEMENLLTELLDISDLKDRAWEAKYIADSLLARKDVLSKELTAHLSIVSAETEKLQEKKTAEDAINTANGNITTLEAKKKAAEDELRDVLLKISIETEKQKERLLLESELSQKQADLDVLNKSLSDKKAYYNERYKTVKTKESVTKALADKLPSLQLSMSQKEAAEKEVADLKRLVISLDDKYVNINKELSAAMAMESQIKEREKELQSLSANRLNSVSLLKKDITEAEKKAKILDSVPCSKDTASVCKFTADAVQAVNNLPSLTDALSQLLEITPREAELEAEIALLKLDTNTEEMKKAAADVLKEKGEVLMRLKKADGDIARLTEAVKDMPLSISAAEALPSITQELASIYEEGQAIVSDIKLQIEKMTADIATIKEKLSVKLDETLTGRKIAIETDIASISIAINEGRKDLSFYAAKIGAVEEALKQIDLAKSQAAGISENIEKLNTDISEWNIVADRIEAIIPLEIDDSGPAISSITNDLLFNAYGPRFSVKISTQDLLANGKGVKDDYDIIVYDAERGESKSLTDMSGGEEIWIEDAITKGTCLFKTGRSGTRFSSLFSDEKDGSLHEKKKQEYMDMKARVLQLGGFKKEFFISHAESVQQKADYVICMDAAA